MRIATKHDLATRCCSSSSRTLAICYALLLILATQASPTISGSHQPSTSRGTTIYAIRHGEKPTDGSSGLTRKGRLRAQCVRRLFGPNSEHHIGYIIAQGFKGEKYKRAYDTVLPLAEELGIEIDTHCKRVDSSCVAKTAISKVSAKNFHGGILISWHHSGLGQIVKLIGVDREVVPSWPGRQYNWIWTLHSNGTFTIEEQDCPYLDYLDNDGNPIDKPPMLIQDSQALLIN